MEIEKFEKLVNDLDENIQKKPIKKSTHFDGIKLNNGDILFNNQVISQYLSRMNNPIKVSLNRVYNKLQKLDPVWDNWIKKEQIIPEEIGDDLLRLGEISRADGKTYAYTDKSNNICYGVVSDRHTRLSHKEFYEATQRFIDQLGANYNLSADCDVLTARLDFDFPDLEIEVADDDTLSPRLIASNSPFGHGALKATGGAVRWACTNGVISGADETLKTYWQQHTINKQNMLDTWTKYLIRVFEQFGKIMDKIEQAVEITEKYIDEKTSLTAYLPDNYDIRVKEAQEVFRIMKSNPKYTNNAFWTGQAVAEMARDRVMSDRTRLEKVAGQVCFAQL